MVKYLRKMAGVASIVLGLSTIVLPTSASAAISVLPSPGGFRPIVVNDTGFVPAQPLSVDMGACGTEIVSVAADQPTRRTTRTVTFRNGDQLTITKGTETVTLVDANAPDDVVNGTPITFTISGLVTKLRFATGALVVNRQADGILLVTSAPYNESNEDEAIAKVGLPNVALITNGSLTEFDNAADTKTTVLTKPVQAKGICDLMGLGAYRQLPTLIYSPANSDY